MEHGSSLVFASGTSLNADILEWLRKARAQPQKIWLMHPGARTPNRRWPLEKFQALVAQTFIPKQIPLIIIDPIESPIPREYFPGALIFHPGGLREFFNLVNAVDCVVCNDTGVSHIAAALGKQVVTISARIFPGGLRPITTWTWSWKRMFVPHRPCLDRCVMPSYICLEAVTVEMVQRMIEKVNSADVKPVGAGQSGSG